MTADTQLDTLEAKGLVRVASLRPELEYLFRHALVQDAAYGSLLKQERRDLHGRVGEALESLYPDRAGELAPVLAMHFEQAGETEKAIEYYAAGGEHALSQAAIQEAFNAYDHAATLIALQPMDAALPPEEAARRRRLQVQVQLGRAQAGYSFLSIEETSRALEAIVATAEELDDDMLIAKVHLFIALGRLQSGDAPTDPIVRRSLDRVGEIGDSIGDPSLRAMPLALVGLSQVFAGAAIREGVAALEEAVPLLEAYSDSIGAAFARGALAIGYASLGEFDKAETAATRASELAKQGDLIAQLDALIAEAMVQSMRGDLARAVPLAQACVDRAEETGATACVIASSWVLGDAFHRLGRFEEARDILQRGADITRVVDRRVWRPTLQAWLGSATSALGEIPEDSWDEALATARSIGNRIGEAGVLGKRAEVAAARGDLAAALPDFEASTAIAEELGMRPAVARGLRSWGEALRAAGRADEAEPILRRSMALFEDMGLNGEAGAIQTMLALGATKLAFD